LDKSTTTVNYDSVGDVISYSYLVTNSGNVPLVPPYAVTDNKATVTCPQTPNPLNPGQSITCTATYVVTQADITAGSVTNIAQASAVYNGAPVTSNQDTVTVPALQGPGIDLVKEVSVDNQVSWLDANSAPGPNTTSGSPVYFRFRVTNTGNVPLTGLTLTDSDFDLSGCSNKPDPFTPGSTYTCTLGPVSAIAGQHSNTGTTTGTYNGTPYSDTDLAHYNTPITPAIDLVKEVSTDNQVTWLDANSAPGPSTTAGSPVYFRFRVTNTGNVPLTGLTLTDSDFNLSGCGNKPDPFAPGSTYTCTYGPVSAIVGQHQNTGSATGTYNATPYSDTDLAHYNTPLPNAVIGNYVWQDLNGNGIQDEPATAGVNGVTVQLYTQAGALVATQVTANSGANPGYYLFTNVAPGSYYVKFTPPVGRVFTVQGPTGAKDATDSDPNPFTGLTEVFAVTNGENDLSWDAGLVQPGAIGDYVWNDLDEDGVQDVGEPGLANVTLELYADDDGTPGLSGGDTLVATTVSNTSGDYLFPNLPPGDYIVDIPTGLNPGLTNYVRTTGPQSQPTPTPVITLAAGEENRDVDFGFALDITPGNAIIGDFVWHDDNGDGVQDPGELGIGGVQVCATPDGGVTNFCATTDPTGRYVIEVPPGTYAVAPTPGQPELTGLTSTTPPVPLPVTVVAGETFMDADFGYDDGGNNLLGSIGDLVWNDTPATGNGDGIFDPVTESGFGNVSVDLILDDGDGVWEVGEPIIASVDTGPNGRYSFTGVPAGSYLVRVSDTWNVLEKYEPTIVPAAGAGDRNKAQPYAVALAANEDDLTADFGYVRGGGDGQGDPVGQIGDLVWHDIDGDGLRDPGEPGIAGVTVELLQGALSLGELTTNGAGNYVFRDLPAGSYTVRVTDDFGVLTTYIVTRLGTPGANDNNQQQPYGVTLATDEDVNLTADFGYVQPVTVGDFAWVDADNDGNYDVGELPLSDVVISILDSSNTVVATLITGPNGGFPAGTYLQGGLLPGTYTAVVVSYPSGVLPGGATSLTTAFLFSGEQDLNLDFPFISTTNVAVYSFTAQSRNLVMTLKWLTILENGNSGFHVQRATQPAGPYQTLTAQPVPSKSVGGAGASYSWVDATAQPGVVYLYKLVTVPDGIVIGPVASESVGGRVFLPLLTRGRR
jgi:hypothetical protein